MSWETVTTVIRSNQLQQVCCEYQSILTEYEKAKESGDKERERHLKSQLASLKQKCPAIMPQAICLSHHLRTRTEGDREGGRPGDEGQLQGRMDVGQRANQEDLQRGI